MFGAASMFADTISVSLQNGATFGAGGAFTASTASGTIFSILSLKTLVITHDDTGATYPTSGNIPLANQASGIANLAVGPGGVTGAGTVVNPYLIPLTNAGTLTFGVNILGGGSFDSSDALALQFYKQGTQTGGASHPTGVFTLVDLTNGNAVVNFASINPTVAGVLGILPTPPPAGGSISLQFTGFVDLALGKVVDFGVTAGNSLSVNGLSGLVVTAATPEPTTIGLIGVGLALIAFKARRHSAKA